jgi:hypothetical protein
MLFLGLLSVSLLSAAALAGPDFGGILRGTIGFQVPARQGSFDPVVVALSLVGAIAGSLANLMYPYFIREKGWTGPEHRRLQIYDLALGVLVLIALDLAVWVVGAEVLHPRGLHPESTQDLAQLLTLTMGRWGGVLIYLGIFAAVASSIVGNALAYSYIATDAYRLWRPGKSEHTPDAYRRHPGFRVMVMWCLFSPLPWILVGQIGFVPLTVMVNAFQVLLLPVLALGMWVLTGSSRFIGPKYRNSPWENAAMACFFGVALLGMAGMLKSLLGMLGG